MAKLEQSDALLRHYDRKKALAHHGVKGMKWGERHDNGHAGQQAKTKKIAKLDKKFERNASTVGTMIKVHNKAADMTNKNDVDRINNKPEYKGQDFLKPSKLRDKYYAEHQKAYTDNLEKVASSFGTNASGTKKYTIALQNDGNWSVTTTDVKHAADTSAMNVKVTYDKNGYIQALEVVDPASDVVVHYGVKGMHWGQRKERGPVAATMKTTKPGKLVKAQGGKRIAPSEDAVRAVKLHQTAKKSTTDALSNDELQSLVRRMQLEQQFAQLQETSPRMPVGKKLARDFLKNGGKDITLETIDKGAGAALSLVPGGKAVKLGVGISAAIAKSIVNKTAGNGGNQQKKKK